MDLDGVLHVCSSLNLAHGSPRDTKIGTWVSIECPLAPWRHQDPVAEARSPGCSIQLNPLGSSYAHCFSGKCGFVGPFRALVRKHVHLLPFPSEADHALLKWIDERERDDDIAIVTRLAEIGDEASKLETRMKLQVESLRPNTLVVSGKIINVDDDLLDEVYLDQFFNGIPTYVTDRGVKVETAKRWGLRFDKRLQRVVFPVRRMDGRLVGCSGRILPKFDAPDERGVRPTKYHNYSGLNKTRYLYGAHLFKLFKPVVVVEGQFDVLKASQALGEDVNVCAALGQGFSDDHRRAIASAQPEAVYLFFDDDSAGRNMAEVVALRMADLAPLFLIRCQGKDPATMTDDVIREALATARPILAGYIDWSAPG